MRCDSPHTAVRQALLALALSGLAAAAHAQTPSDFPSTYKPANGSFAIRGATILTAEGAQLEDSSILVLKGRISAIGRQVAVPDGVMIFDGKGKWVTPGLIDMHSHLGVSSAPTSGMNRAHNEQSGPNAAQVYAEHSVRADDPGFARARESGVTTLQVLPGSINVFGGRTVVLRNVPSVTVEGMKYPGAPYGLKMACGENPARTYGAKDGPSTPMGDMALARTAFLSAQRYRTAWHEFDAAARAGKPVAPPARDLQLEALAGVLDGSVRLQIHCYRADQMMQMVGLSHEFGFKITAFHHATDAYRIAPLLVKEGIGVATWADVTGPSIKMESWNGIPENGAFVDRAGGLLAVHSDSADLIQHLHSKAGRLRALSDHMGWPVSRAQAIRWLTLNPAILLGIARDTGSLAVGKRGDVVLWNTDPFSTYSVAQKVFIDGGLAFDRDGPADPDSDFALGTYRRAP